MKFKYLILAAVVVAAGTLVWIFGPFGSQAPPVIIISVDTLRPDHLGCYGYARDTSPNVDAFAGESTLFTRCFSQAPSTRPSCGVILTGFFPHELKIFNNSDKLAEGVVSLPEILRQAGYTTIGVVSNFVLRKTSGYEQGFDYYDDQMDDTEITRGLPERIAAKTTDTAISLLRLNHEKRFFMWIHYQDPHGPYDPPPPYNTMFLDESREPRLLPVNETVSGMGGIPSYQAIGGIRDYNHYVSEYDGEIRYFDENFGRLIREIKALGLYDKVLIILTADHGEGMGEHDYYFAHGEYVYNSLIHVPLIVHGGKSGVTRDDYARHIDIVPTVLSYAGMKPGDAYRGVNLLEQSAGELPIFSEMPGKYSVIDDGLKLIQHVETGEFMLFDVARDPGESENLLANREYAGRARDLAASIQRYRQEDRLGDLVNRDIQSRTADEKRKLKALGYVQ
jgi:arylsulfatase A-like enzyme